MSYLKSFAVLLLVLITSEFVMGQNSVLADLPINTVPSGGDSSKPMIVYITGDGGWNSFSKNLAQEFATRGYPVVALNARSYFWKKKTASQTGADVGLLVKNYRQLWKRRQVILLGYSFGADVLPFAFNHLPPELAAAVSNISLLSPSPSTDFEIHLSVMFGGSVSGGASVPDEINKITGKPLTLVFGKEEKDFSTRRLKISNYATVVLEGGHHYDGDEARVCETVIQQLSRK